MYREYTSGCVVCIADTADAFGVRVEGVCVGVCGVREEGVWVGECEVRVGGV